VHPSNFTIEGFTERPSPGELAALARRFNLPLVEDLGSGWLGVADLPVPVSEPSVAASLRAGADLVAFSGDKLLGGPQAGLIVGRRDLVARVRAHPLMRAVRADKLTYAVLEATLVLWMGSATRGRIPVYRMLAQPADAIGARARAFAAGLRGLETVTVDLVPGHSTIGGGSAPGSALPTLLLAIEIAGVSAATLDARLRAGRPPVVTRIENDRVVVDLRTVPDDDEADLLAALRASVQD